MAAQIPHPDRDSGLSAFVGEPSVTLRALDYQAFIFVIRLAREQLDQELRSLHAVMARTRAHEGRGDASLLPEHLVSWMGFERLQALCDDMIALDEQCYSWVCYAAADAPVSLYTGGMLRSLCQIGHWLWLARDRWWDEVITGLSGRGAPSAALAREAGERDAQAVVLLAFDLFLTLTESLYGPGAFLEPRGAGFGTADSEEIPSAL